jgi:hypothetical protein
MNKERVVYGHNSNHICGGAMELILENQETWREENSDLKESSLEIMKKKISNILTKRKLNSKMI